MVFVKSHAIISPLGIGSEQNFDAIKNNKTALQPYLFKDIGTLTVSKFDQNYLYDSLGDISCNDNQITFQEYLCIKTIEQATQHLEINLKDSTTLFVFSTTKGNIDILENSNFNAEKLYLSSFAKTITKHFQNKNTPVVVSNACISGVQALEYAHLFIKSRKYKNIVVCGVDVVSKFVASGFFSFQALSSSPCKPFDSSRNGLNLGESCACIVISEDESSLEIKSITSSNDANHLSGPSRTGEGLVKSIKQTLKLAQLNPENIDYICAHGTATIYNDEMEATALQQCDLNTKPVNSFKGYYGHTLGAAGILETVLAIKSLENNYLIKSMGFEKLGVSTELNIQSESTNYVLKTILKTASGFGGCNASLIISKS